MSTRDAALIATFSTTEDIVQLRKLTEVARNAFSSPEIKQHLVQNGALELLGTRLWQAIHARGSAEEASLVSDVLRLLLVCDASHGKDFVIGVGMSLVSATIDFLQTSEADYGSQNPITKEQENLHMLLVQMASMPWHELADVSYEKLVRLLQRTLREPATIQVLATSICFLSKLASGTTKKRFLAECPGLVEDVLQLVIETTENSRNEVDKAIIAFSCKFLRRLAWGTTNRFILARKKKWNQALFQLLENHDVEIKAEVFQIICQMSTEMQHRQCMIKYEDAAFVRHVMISLKNPSVMYPAIHALSSLINKDSAKGLGAYDGAFGLLSDLAANEEARLASKAAKVLQQVSRHISVRDRGHENLKDALLLAARSSQLSVRLWAAKGLLAQSEEKTNAFLMARSREILDVVIDLSADADSRIRKAATQTLLNAASEASNTRRAASTTEYLNAFVRNSMELLDTTDEESIDTLRASIQGILKLSDHPKGYHRVAKQNRAIEALAGYGVSNDKDAGLKSAALKAVVILCPFL